MISTALNWVPALKGHQDNVVTSDFHRTKLGSRTIGCQDKAETSDFHRTKLGSRTKGYTMMGS